MRTLKKSLALVLALVMVLGLGVVGASADNALDNYTDTGDIGDAYLEAVGVLTGLGIVDGMTDTTIEPDGTYTRAQAAKIVATMLLGVDAADSLKATTAPFEDVPTYHWASGYIAYCVEAGIIDGMTATTFEPEGTLTGFQWAKMLLSAVGFGVNGEFEGDSWSLNTATVGHQSGLFTGDLDGADHVALRREQAMLYAFNALTKLPQVTYSKENTNYLYGILGYFFADGTGHTLGDDTFDLTFVEGQIIDNEGMGASKTYIDNVADGRWDPDVVTVKADTGLDLMYHAVRAWYVDDKNHTGVYTYDLAETTNYDCATLSDGSKAATKNKATEYTIGDGTVYETALVDNTALDLGYSYVKFEYTLGEIGVPSTAKDTLVIKAFGKAPAVPNDNIKTDVSKMSYGQDVIVLVADSPETGNDTYAYYVYAMDRTSGVVTGVDKNGTITLRDGTKIAKSALSTESYSKNDFATGVSYTFTLDTHGHYIGLNENYTLVYFTGAATKTNGTYLGEAVYDAQVVNVQETEDTLVRVSRTDALKAPGYYWLSEPTLNGVYSLEAWSPSFTYTAGYAYDDSETFFSTTGVQEVRAPEGGSPDLYYNASSVQFIYAEGKGSNLDIHSFDGVDEMLKYFNATGATTGSVTLGGIAMTTTAATVGNREVTIVFAYNATATSRYVFIPFGADASAWDYAHETADGGVVYEFNEAAYLNGTKVTLYCETAPKTLVRGFYSVTVNEDGYDGYTLVNATPIWEYAYEQENIVKAGGSYAQNYSFKRQFADDAQVFDLRSGVLDEELDAITNLDQFCYTEEDPCQLAYTWNADGEIDVCYVVDWNLGVVGVSFADNMTGWYVNGRDSVDVMWEDETFIITSDGIAALDAGTKVDFTFKTNLSSTERTVSATVKENAFGGKYVEIDFHAMNGDGGEYFTYIQFTGATYNVTVTNAQDEFALWYKNPAEAEKAVSVEGNTVTFKVNVGDKIALGFTRSNVAEGTAATVAMTGAADQNVVWKANGNVGTPAFVATTNEVTVDSILADYSFVLNEGNASAFSFSKSDDNDDTLLIKNIVPGNEVEFTIYQTVNGGKVGDDLVINNLYYSNNPSTGAQGDAFGYNFVPTANEMTFTLSWSSENQQSNPGVTA